MDDRFEAMALKTVIKMLLSKWGMCRWICRESRTIRKFTARMAMEVTVTTSGHRRGAGPV